jgi:demethylmenaquinone methyltransferase/2-methoxy-6-polyprenyl-1,4-benzoquinol methylase
MFLDIGAGTGEVGIEIARQAPGSMVVGIDPAPGMLAYAARKVRKAGLQDGISFMVADVSALPFDDGFFNGVITAFTIRNIQDREEALRKMFRVLRHGGRLVILELTSPDGPILSLLHLAYNRSVVPLAARLLSRKEAYRYLVNSIEKFPPPQAVMEVMAAAGFRDTVAIRLSGGIVTLITGKR